MRSVTRAVRVVALTLVLGTVAATSGAGVASAWWSGIQFGSQQEKLSMVPGVGIPDDDKPRYGDLNPGLQGITPSMLPVGLRPAVQINGVDSAIQYSRQFSGALDPRQNPDAPPGSAAAAKTAATAKPGPSRTTKPGPARTNNSRGR